MRVISGSAKGHRLKAPDGISTRPTTDRIKESLFNILAPDLYGCEFLDLFSGSGGIGIEALSRGASRAVFVDSSDVCRKIIIENLEHTKLTERAEVFREDVFSALRMLSKKGESFDLIFLDPPYDKGLTETVLSDIVKYGILKDDGYIVAERSSKYPSPETQGLRLLREKDYKTTVMAFMALEDR